MNWKVFIGRRRAAHRSYQQKKRKDCFRPGHLLSGVGGGRMRVYHAGYLFIPWWGNGQGPVIEYFTGADQKIPDWPITITFLGKVKTTVRSGMKSRSVIMGFSTGDAIWGLWFFFPLTGGCLFLS